MIAALTLLYGAGCSGSAPPRAAPPPTTAVPASTEYAGTAQAARWLMSTSPALALGGGTSASLGAVLTPQAGNPWQIVGSRFDASGVPTATVWSSADGLVWSAAPLIAGEGASQARDAVSFRGLTVVVGAVGEGANQQAAVWVSTATGFERVPVPQTDGPSSMEIATGGKLGFFAAGTIDGRFALWESTDALHWSELTDAERVITGTPGATVHALLEVGQTIYAAGSVQPGGVLQAAVWSSFNGLDWSSVQSAESSFTGTMGRVIYSLAALGPGLVAVGAVDTSSGWYPASWITPNGASWSLPSTDFPASAVAPANGSPTDLGPSGGSAALSVSAVPSLDSTGPLVAAGGGPYGQSAWRSSDGLHWTSLGLPPGAAGSGTWEAGLVASDGNVTVVADRVDGQPYVLVEKAGAWNEVSAQPTVFGPIRVVARPVSLVGLDGQLELTVQVVTRPQAIGAATVTDDYFTSADGVNWTPTTNGPPPASLPAPGALAAPLGAGWLAVSSGRAAAPEVWSSPAGTSWTSTGALPPVFSASPSLSGATVLPAGETPGPEQADAVCTPTPSVPPSPNGVPSGGSAPTTATTTTATTTTATNAGTSTTAGTPTAGPQIVMVGDAVTVSPAGGNPPDLTAPAAWLLDSAGTWTAEAPDGVPAPGNTAVMSGCTSSSGPQGLPLLLAFGSAIPSSGPAQPQIWKSADGRTWTRLSAPQGVSYPLLSLAVSGSAMLAVASGDPGSHPLAPDVAGAAGPGAAAGLPDFTVPSPGVARSAAWVSTDGGSTWTRVDTGDVPWEGAGTADLESAGFAEGHPVLAGSLDGRLEVWSYR